MTEVFVIFMCVCVRYTCESVNGNIFVLLGKLNYYWHKKLKLRITIHKFSLSSAIVFSSQ